MKKTLIMMAVAVIGLTSCQKDDLPQLNSSNRVGNNTNVVDSLDYTLDFRCDSLHINITYLHSYRYGNILYSLPPTPNMPIGKVFWFKTQNGPNFTVWFNWNGRMTSDVSGNINGHTFSDLNAASTNGTLNMCNYAQNVPYTFTLKNSKGEIVMTNTSNALSR
jgi:hypothetical protein